MLEPSHSFPFFTGNKHTAVCFRFVHTDRNILIDNTHSLTLCEFTGQPPEQMSHCDKISIVESQQGKKHYMSDLVNV